MNLEHGEIVFKNSAKRSSLPVQRASKMGSITGELNGDIYSSIAGRWGEFLRLLNYCQESFRVERRETAAYSPTVHPGDRPLAFYRLGYVGQQFQVGVPGCICNTQSGLSCRPFNSSKKLPEAKDSRVKHTAEELNDSEYQRSSEAPTKDHRVWGRRNDGSGLSITFHWEGSCYCTSPLNVAQ